MQGFVVHIEVELLDGGPVLSSWCSGSHWANVFVMMPEVIVKDGTTVHLRVISNTSGPTPVYSFEARHTDGSGAQTAIGIAHV